MKGKSALVLFINLPPANCTNYYILLINVRPVKIQTSKHIYTYTHTHILREVHTITVAVSNLDNVNCNAEFITFTELYI